MRKLICSVGALLFASAGWAQLSSTAYRALGQPDLQQNGLNTVQGSALNVPTGLTLDSRGGVTHIYISDAGNSRILGWTDAGSYQFGDPPAVVLGQPAPYYSNPVQSPASLKLPYGLSVDPATGNLYVADQTNNRILRFPSPFSNPGGYQPDAVIGQQNFTTSIAGLSGTALRQPQALAFDSTGNLWVADSGNNRVLRFPSTVLDGRSSPQADLVIGQKDFISGGANGGGNVSASGLSLPDGIAFDSRNTLYVSDFNNGRVLTFSAPVLSGASATAVFGQATLTARVIQTPSNASMAGPGGLAISPSGSIYVSVPSENRVLIFPAGNSTAGSVLGQPTLTSAQANASTSPFASPNGLFTPTDVKVDSSGNVYVVDSGNNRVLAYSAASRSASKVWGQQNFTANGPNEIKAGSLNGAFKMAIDYSQAPYALYISDTGNHRILIWQDSTQYRSGDPADLVIGQPDLLTGVKNVDTGELSTPTATSLFSPKGIAVDSSGGLYVADSGNNRVLHYPRPVNQSGRIAPDAVLGQANFSSSATGVASATSLQAPSGLAIGPMGELYVADTGHNRVLEFLPPFGANAAAIQVFGQPNLNSGTSIGSVSPQTLNSPIGIFVDPAYNLYVADTGNNRVLVFTNTQSSHGNGLPATSVFGQNQFGSGAPGGGPAGLQTPTDVALDSAGNIYVSDAGNNRVVEYPSLLFAQQSGTAATSVTGQNNFSGNKPDWDTPDGSLATADSLFEPLGIYLDRQGTLYVSDAGNFRVLQFLHEAFVVNSASPALGIPTAAGSLASLFSPIVVPAAQGAGTVPLPQSLARRQVVINDSIVAPLLYVGNNQVNFQIPSAAPVGTNRIAIRTADTGELISGEFFLVSSVGPGLYTATSNGMGQGAIVNTDFTINGPSHPAPRNSTISLYGTGQGQVSPPVPDGQAAQSAPLSWSVGVFSADPQSCLGAQAICVVFGNSGNSSFGVLQYSGLAPGAVGEWQINVTIPAGAPVGNAVPVKVLIDGVSTNTVTVAIK